MAWNFGVFCLFLRTSSSWDFKKAKIRKQKKNSAKLNLSLIWILKFRIFADQKKVRKTLVLLKHTVPNFWGLEFWDTLFLTCDDSADGTGYLRRILVSFTKSRGRWWHWKCQKNFYRWNLIFKELFLVCSANHRGRWPIKGESLNNPSKIQFPLSTTRFGILLLKENYFKREIQIRNHFLKEPYSTHKIYLRAPQSLKKLNPDGTSFLRS